jgi:hypothetical protein
MAPLDWLEHRPELVEVHLVWLECRTSGGTEYSSIQELVEMRHQPEKTVLATNDALDKVTYRFPSLSTIRHSICICSGTGVWRVAKSFSNMVQ